MSKSKTVMFDTRAGALVQQLYHEARALVLDEITGIIARYGDPSQDLYRLMLDYPLRPAKAPRPALCIATARALGGTTRSVIRSAAVVELFHNAFLIHDDVEDGSLFRRGTETLQHQHGVPVAVNVADGMFALALRPLLENTETVGLGAALEILELVADTVRITVEGQAVELEWIRDHIWQFPGGAFRAAYEDMVSRKTGHYSFVAPVEIACIATRTDGEVRAALRSYAHHLGVAFQIADDLLNLTGPSAYGKERDGDLWEGKRTLILLHALSSEGETADARAAVEGLGKRRPNIGEASDDAEHRRLLEQLHAAGHLDDVALRALARSSTASNTKSVRDIDRLRGLIRKHDSEAYARAVADDHCREALASLRSVADRMAPGKFIEFLRALTVYVAERME